MKQKQLRLAAALLALGAAVIVLAGCTHQADDIKAAHTHEDASAQQARADKRTN